MSGIFIQAIGTAIPENEIRQERAMEYLINSFEKIPEEALRKIRAIFKRSGIEKRYTVQSSYCRDKDFLWGRNNGEVPFTRERMEIFKEEAPALALKSIKTLPDSLELNIDSLIAITCTGLMAPGLEIMIANKLQLTPQSKKMAVNFMGCYGMFHGWKIAENELKASQSKRVLISSVELCSLHFQRNLENSDILANAIFGDGAACCVLTSIKPTERPFLELLKTGTHLFPEGAEDLKWEVSDTGFEMILSSELPRLIRNNLKGVIDRFLREQGLDRTEIDFFAIHPGGPKILEESKNALMIDSESMNSSTQVLRDFGNMSSTTILFILNDLLEKLRKVKPKKTQNILALAFGPGFTIELATFRVHV
jgi:predicted naringenin-chalcone synthase